MSSKVKSIQQTSTDWLVGGGEMGAHMRALDWEKTPLGPLDSWSPTLKMMVRFLLVNRFPLLLWWGPQFCQLYNDAYRPILGTKHPQFLGRPVNECWSEIWHILRPLIETPFDGGPATWMEDIQLEINRYGFTEETHFTIAYSPVPDETVASGIGGVLATVHEISDKVVSERRIVVLRDLSARTTEAKTAEDACAVAAMTLARHPKDIPFALLYLIDDTTRQLRLAGAAAILPPDVIERLSLAHRNSLRLLKLVNTLLDFSRIEAGRIEAAYEPVDLSALTAELASNFRSAIERAGLSFVVNCAPLPDDVHVDREMWEKIVLNLLSNAFKFTLAGEIKVELRQAGETVELLVSDTGIGIPAAETARKPCGPPAITNRIWCLQT